MIGGMIAVLIALCMCLCYYAYKHKPCVEPKTFTLLINSSASYACKTLPPLLDSLREAHVPDDAVVIVIGDAPHGWIPDENLARHANSKRMYTCHYNSIDLTAMVFASENDIIHTPWVFTMHDTTMVGPDFWHKLTALFEAKVHGSGKHVWQLLNKFSMSMGFVRTTRLKRFNFEDVKLHNASPQKVRDTKLWIEDYPFKQTQNKGHLGTYGDPHVRVGKSKFKYADDSHSRTHEYYPFVDIHKFKSWMGQPGEVPIGA